MEIRPAEASDLPALVDIYNHYVLHSFATFDEEPATVRNRRAWFETFKADGKYRLFVVADDHQVVGYAGSSVYRPHVSFAQTVETTVYLSPATTSKGVGTALYGRLLAELRTEGVHRVLAGIALPNEASMRLHRRFGFETVGTFNEYAKKWDKYVSSVWVQLRFRPPGSRRG